MKFIKTEAGSFVNANTIGEIYIDTETERNCYTYQVTKTIYKVMFAQAFTGCPRHIYKKAKTEAEAKGILAELVADLADVR